MKANRKPIPLDKAIFSFSLLSFPPPPLFLMPSYGRRPFFRRIGRRKFLPRNFPSTSSPLPIAFTAPLKREAPPPVGPPAEQTPISGLRPPPAVFFFWYFFFERLVFFFCLFVPPPSRQPLTPPPLLMLKGSPQVFHFRVSRLESRLPPALFSPVFVDLFADRDSAIVDLT